MKKPTPPPLNVSKNQDPEVWKKLDLVMSHMAMLGITPVIVVGLLPDGSTIDMHNEAICGKCLAERLKQISDVYHEANPTHREEEKKKTDRSHIN